MENTIKLLKFSLVMLYLSFIGVILEMIIFLIVSIATHAETGVSTFWWVLLDWAISIVVLIIVNVFIKLIEGSIEEHIKIYERVLALEKDNQRMVTKQVKQPFVKKENVTNEKVVHIAEATKEESIKQQVESKPMPPKEESVQIRVKSSDVLVANSQIKINGKAYNMNKVEDLSALGNELHFVIGKNHFIVEYDYFSEASKMYDDIDKYLPH